METLIPPTDPLGIPTPPWIFESLYILTFLLHIIFMNYVLGGTIIVAVHEWFSGSNSNAMHGNHLMLRVMPVSLSLAITMGVAPLLFVQVMYGQFFYTSNVIMGWLWFSIFILVAIGFYFIYIMLAKRPSRGQSSTITKVLATINALLFLAVAFFFTSNAVITEHPNYWEELYTGGLPIPFSEGSLIPRYLHNVIGAVAVAGLWMAVIGRYQVKHHPSRAEVGKRLENSGLIWAIAPTLLQLVIGFIFLFSIGSDRIKAFMGSGILFFGWALSILLALATLFIMILALIKPENTKLLWVAVGHMAATLLGMVMGRQLLRRISLSEHFDLYSKQVTPEYSSLAMFLVTLVIGLGVLAYVVRMVWRLPSEASESVEAPPHEEQE